MSTEVNLEILEGKSFRAKVRWLGEAYKHIPIQSISNGGPVRIVTQVPHTLTNGWPVAVVAAGGLKELNAAKNPPDKKDYRAVSVIDPVTIEFNELNGAMYGVHTAGTGFLQFREPMPLAGTEPRWVVKDKVDGTLLLEATVGSGLTVDTVNMLYEILLDVDKTTALTWAKGVHELESRDPAIPFTYKVIHGKITVSQELATPTV